VRVGYLLGSPENIGYVSKVRTGYETNSVSAEVVSFFIDNYSLVENYIKEVKEGLAYLKGELKKKKLEYTGGETSNFIYVNLRSKIWLTASSAGSNLKTYTSAAGGQSRFLKGFPLQPAQNL